MAGPAPIEAASAALVWEGRVLMVRRAREPGRGLLAFPGGRLQPGETPEAAARREVFEETGLVPEELVRLSMIDPLPPDNLFRLHIFAGAHSGGTPVASDDAEHAAWYRLEDLACLAVTATSLELARLLLQEDLNKAGLRPPDSRFMY